MLPLNRDLIKTASQGRWLGILTTLGIAVPSNPKKHAPCPACGEGRNRFRFDDRDGHGSYICNQCGAGDGLSLVLKTHRCTFPEALRLVSDALGRPDMERAPLIQPRSKSPNNAFTARLAMRLWDEAHEDTGRIRAYLVSRGLSGHVPHSLRLHPRLSYIDEGVTTHLPAIVAQVTGLTGPLPAIHRTYLDPHGDGKAKLENGKKSLGAITGGAIRLSHYQPNQPLILSEGIENGLAVQQSTGWQAWHASLRMVSWLPKSLRIADRSI